MFCVFVETYMFDMIVESVHDCCTPCCIDVSPSPLGNGAEQKHGGAITESDDEDTKASFGKGFITPTQVEAHLYLQILSVLPVFTLIIRKTESPGSSCCSKL